MPSKKQQRKESKKQKFYQEKGKFYDSKIFGERSIDSLLKMDSKKPNKRKFN